jgi:hypothetical protein
MKSTVIRFPEESSNLLPAIKKSAQKNRRSMNAEILRALEFYLKEAPEAQYEVKSVKEVAKKKTP